MKYKNGRSCVCGCVCAHACMCVWSQMKPTELCSFCCQYADDEAGVASVSPPRLLLLLLLVIVTGSIASSD